MKNFLFFLRFAFLYFPRWEGYKALLLGGVLRARHVLVASGGVLLVQTASTMYRMQLTVQSPDAA